MNSYKPVVPAPVIPKEYGKPSMVFDRNIDRFRPQPSAGGRTFPFEILDRSTPGEAPVAAIFVRRGTVNGVAPVGVGTAIPLGDGTWTIYLDVELDLQGGIVGVTLSSADDGQPTDEDFHAYITLGQADAGSGELTAIRQAAQHSLGFIACGRVVTDGVLTARGSYEFRGL